jgi:deazaflavin-dependent oxidoreductase (nitroreductase family)
MSFEEQTINEFRANGGKVGGYFANMRLVLLHNTGAKSGVERVTPLAYLPVDAGYAIFASKGGADENPAWYHNVLANPATSIEVGTETVQVVAREAQGEERETIWKTQVAAAPSFGEYERKTKRDHIPVVVLEPARN